MRKISTALVSFALLFAAAPLIAQIPPAAAVSTRAAISGTEPGERVEAVLALRKTGGPAALKGLLDVITVEKHKGVRIHAVNALGFFDAPEARARLREIAGDDPDGDLRTAAVMALSRLGDTQYLADAFDVETSTHVKIAIVDALARTEDGEKELEKIKSKSGDKRIKGRLNLYVPDRKKAKGR
ncbi:MAG: HEAT repeat domain-containing protein [Elusimicrobiota bacterium]